MTRHWNPLGFPLEDVLAQGLPPKLTEIHVNHRYMLSWAKAVALRRTGARILDFGCGPGMVVEAGRTLGMECFGADAFYEGEQDLPLVQKTGLFGTAIRRIEMGKVPFDDDSFDLIVSNQVIEHVEKLDETLAELSRVAKPDALLLFLFPSREVIREAHCGVPFLHWFRPGSPARIPYAARWKWAGFSFDKDRKTREAWAKEAVEWMDRFVFYRTRHEIRSLFARYFDCLPMEGHYLAYRLLQKRRGKVMAPFLRIPWFGSFGRSVCHLLNGVVVLARKKRDLGTPSGSEARHC